MIAIVGGAVGVITILARKFKLYIHRNPEVGCQFVIGLLDKPLPINNGKNS